MRRAPGLHTKLKKNLKLALLIFAGVVAALSGPAAAVPLQIGGGVFTGLNGTAGGGPLGNGIAGSPEYDVLHYSLCFALGGSFPVCADRVAPGGVGTAGGSGGQGPSGLAGGAATSGYAISGQQLAITGGTFVGGSGGIGGAGGSGGIGGTGQMVAAVDANGMRATAYGGAGGDGGTGGAGGAGGWAGSGLVAFGANTQVSISGGTFVGGLGGTGGNGGIGGGGGDGGYGVLAGYNDNPYAQTVVYPPNGGLPQFPIVPNPDYNPTPLFPDAVGGTGGNGGDGGMGGIGGISGFGVAALGTGARIDIFGGQFTGASGGQGGAGGSGGGGGDSPISGYVIDDLDACRVLRYFNPGPGLVCPPSGLRSQGGQGGLGGLGSGGGGPYIGTQGAGWGGFGGDGGDNGFGGFDGFGLFADLGGLIVIHGTGAFDPLTGLIDGILQNGEQIHTTGLAILGGQIVFVNDPLPSDPGTNPGPSSVPEPGSLALLGLGLTSLVFGRRRVAARQKQ